jgi:hypothetical protein
MFPTHRSIRLYSGVVPHDYLVAVTYIKAKSIFDVFSTTSTLAVRGKLFRMYEDYFKSETLINDELMIEYIVKAGGSIVYSYYDAYMASYSSSFIQRSNHYFTNSIGVVL